MQQLKLSVYSNTTCIQLPYNKMTTFLIFKESQSLQTFKHLFVFEIS